MLHPIRRAGWALATLGIGLLVGAAGPPGQKNKPTLAGTWKLNAEKTAAEQSAQPGDPTVREGYRPGGRPRVGTGMTGGGSARPGGGGGESGGGAGRANLGPLGLYARPLPELVVVQTDSSITISDPRGTPRTYRTDGRKEIEPLLGADSLEIVAKWKDGKLTTERKLGSFGSVREVYWIDSDSHALVLEVRLSGPGITPPLAMRRIYDAAPGS